jgi:hypothetical protein
MTVPCAKLRPEQNPGASSAAPKIESILGLFFRKERRSSFSEEKEAKRLLLFQMSLVTHQIKILSTCIDPR